MARLTYNERFTNVRKYTEDGSYTGLQIASKLNQKNGQDYKLIDAIDIDWNGVWSDAYNGYINDTYDLIYTIDNIADLADLEWVRERINELTENVDLIMSTYVTQSELEEILKHYEHALEAGEHISISDDNIISTYDLLTPEEADEKFATLEEFLSLVQHIHENYYDKTETFELADDLSKSNIQNIVVKDADERFNDLEKISNWILSQPGDITSELESVNDRLNRLDEVVGYVIYNEETDTYSYTAGALYDIDELFRISERLAEGVNLAIDTANIAEATATTAYETSIEAYAFAYLAYETAMQSDQLAVEAYAMAYQSIVTIGNPSEDPRWEELTEEDIALLNENPTVIDVYAIREGNESGIPRKEPYDPEFEGIYYKFIPGVEATGFHKDIEDISLVAYEAKYSADNALYRLLTQTTGTSYAHMSLSPEENDGTNVRTLILNVDEAEVNSYTGEIEQPGFITTYSLANSLSYIQTFVIIEKENIENEENEDGN